MTDLLLRNVSYDPSDSMFQFVKTVFPKIDLVENGRILMVKADVPGFPLDCLPGVSEVSNQIIVTL